MSVSDLISKVSATAGSAGAVFKDPTVAARAELDSVGRLNDLFFSGIPDVGAGLASGLTSSIGSAASGLQGAMAGKMAALPLQMMQIGAVVNMENLVAKAEGFAAGIEPNIPAPCSQHADAFKSVTDFASVANTAALASSVKSGIDSALSAIPSIKTDVFAAISAATGSAITDMNQAMAALAAMPQNAFNSLKASVTTIVSDTLNLPENLAALNTLKTDATNAVNAATSSVTGMVSSVQSQLAAEAAVITAGVSNLINMSFLNTINAPTTPECLRSVQTAALDSTNIDEKALRALQSAQSTPTLIEHTRGVANTRRDLVQDDLGGTPPRVYVPPTNNSDAYTSAELRAMYSVIEAQRQTNNALGESAAQKLKEFEEWKRSVNWNARRDEVGASKEAPFGTTTDQSLKDAWVPLLMEQRARANEYNNSYNAPHKTSYNTLQQMLAEHNNRTKYGKHYATNMKANGQDIADEQITTLLDSTS